MSEAREQDLVQEGVLPPEDFHDSIERIREVADYDIDVPADLAAQLDKIGQEMLVDRGLLDAAATALIVGHLVLQGPPGSGKSMLARALVRAFGCSAVPVTAHEEWSAFEVIGRQELQIDAGGKDSIVPVNGFFTEAVVQCAGSIVRHFDKPTEPQATWLLIDEMNRAHLDRAFGELFTVLGTDELVPIVLPHQVKDNRELVTPRRFRIIGTLNSIDKQFVNSLGQGLKRRFTFLTVDIPPRRRAGEPWGDSSKSASLASREFTVVNLRARERVFRRLQTEDPVLDATIGTDIDQVVKKLSPGAERLFELVEGVRYAKEGDGAPFLPIGTAQLIDTVELALSRLMSGEADDKAIANAIDWAAAVKLAPLFDTDLRPDVLKKFAGGLPAPFDQAFRHSLLEVLSAGLYYVD